MEQNNMLNALEEFGRSYASSEANQIRQKILEKAMQNVNLRIDQEKFKEDVKAFLETLGDDYILEGVNVFYGRPREGARIYETDSHEGYTFYLEESLETSKRKYTLKICYAYKDSIPEDDYLKKRLQGFFQKVVKLENQVVDDALDVIIAHLNPDFTMEVGVCGYQGFKTLASNSNGAELICLDGLPQGREHISQALVKDGMMWIFATGLRPRSDYLIFRLRRQEEP